MAHTYRVIRRDTIRQSDVDDDTVVAPAYDGMTLAARIVYFIGGFIMAILGIRFVLSLLGANRGNEIASFIYTLSHPFVAPFFGLFNYQEQIGVVRFEFETLVAILFWGFVTWVIVRLLTLGSPAREV